MTSVYKKLSMANGLWCTLRSMYAEYSFLQKRWTDLCWWGMVQHFFVYTVEDEWNFRSYKPTVLKIKKELKESFVWRKYKNVRIVCIFKKMWMLNYKNMNTTLCCRKGRDKGTVVYHHVKNLRITKGCVLSEIESNSEENSVCSAYQINYSCVKILLKKGC